MPQTWQGPILLLLLPAATEDQRRSCSRSTPLFMGFQIAKTCGCLLHSAPEQGTGCISTLHKMTKITAQALLPLTLCALTLYGLFLIEDLDPDLCCELLPSRVQWSQGQELCFVNRRLAVILMQRKWLIISISNSLLSGSYAQQLLNFGGNFQKILSLSLSVK